MSPSETMISNRCDASLVPENGWISSGRGDSSAHISHRVTFGRLQIHSSGHWMNYVMTGAEKVFHPQSKIQLLTGHVRPALSQI
jgi:hypothetical protein